jgi:hypothetical protein
MKISLFQNKKTVFFVLDVGTVLKYIAAAAPLRCYCHDIWEMAFFFYY